MDYEVSIHAPAWGATVANNKIFVNAAGFNPRARMGRDNSGEVKMRICIRFNPRARMGRDYIPR